MEFKQFVSDHKTKIMFFCIALIMVCSWGLGKTMGESGMCKGSGGQLYVHPELGKVCVIENTLPICKTEDGLINYINQIVE